MLKLIVQHSPKLLAVVCGVPLHLPKPQWQHVLRLTDALVVSEARHKTIARLSRLIVEAPDPSHGADTLRISPWTAEDLRAPIRHFIVADLVAYAPQSDHGTLDVSLDDSLDEKDKGPRHLEAVEYHHDHTQSQGKKQPDSTKGAVHVEVRFELGARSYAYEWRLYLREQTVRRLNRERDPEQRLHFRKKTALAQEMLAALQQRLPSDFQVDVLFDSWYAANRLLKCCRRQGWPVVCAITSNRKLDDQKLSQWPQALRHQRSQRGPLAATDGRQRSSLVRPLQGKLTHLSLDVCVLIRKRHPRDKHPQYFLCTDLSLSASYEATEKWCAMVFLALVFLPWRLNPAHAKDHVHSLADVVRQHRYEHARTLLETACQEAAQLRDYFPVLKRFLCQPT